MVQSVEFLTTNYKWWTALLQLRNMVENKLTRILNNDRLMKWIINERELCMLLKLVIYKLYKFKIENNFNK